MNAAVINKNAKLQRVPEACADTNWSRNTLMKVAAEANAIIRVGRTVRIDMPVQVEALQGECELYQSILDSGHCEPLSWLWCICQNRLLIS